MNHLIASTAIAAAVLAICAGAARAATLGTEAIVYTLGNNGTTLVTLAAPDGAAPSAVTLSFGAMMPVTMEAIAYRPKTLQLYGYDNGSDAVYEIDVATGAATRVAAAPGATQSGRIGFDFNNVIDAARIVSRETRNLVFFPNTMPPTLERKTDLFYIAGDTNEGADPGVVMNAYTNAVPDAMSTLQYVIDVDRGVLATLDNNAGALRTVGALTLDGAAFRAGVNGGMDILSFSEGDNTAFALLTDRITKLQGIYRVDLTSGALSLVEEAPSQFGPLTGLAVAAATAPVPVPASLPLLAAGIGSMVWMRRTRRMG